MGDVQQVTINGEFTIFTAAEIRSRLLSAFEASDKVEMDLSGVTEMDTAGLQIILAAQLEARVRNKMLALTGRSSAVEEVLALYGLGDRFSAPSTSTSSSPSTAPSAA